tara:strand:- start:1161 stop:2141 length:981 start_codon:yes stop_codon:yes gene_type:complete
MGFLDNSGDIILDAVLTDTGRFRLAKGDGSFKITKYAFGDDEINYEIYNKNHTSGSAYYDLKILQTPVLEAFTNNTSTMNSKLVSIPRTNLLFLPIMMLMTKKDESKQVATVNMHYVAVDSKTEDMTAYKNTDADAAYDTASPGTSAPVGILHGANPAYDGAYIAIDQGLHTTKISQNFTLDPDLKEGQYIIQLDNRLGSLAAATTGNPMPVNYIDDDQIATYYVSGQYVEDLFTVVKKEDNKTNKPAANETPLDGPLGTRIRCKIRSSTTLQTSPYLFETLGGNKTLTLNSSTYNYIDTSMKVTGVSTGYSIDIPLRFIKWQSTP